MKINERRKRIIEEATALFGQKGYHATSIQDIVEHSEMSKGSFYNYFNSKEELVISIIEYHHEVLLAHMLRIEQQAGTERSKLMQQLLAQLEYAFKHKDLIQMQMQEQVLQGHAEVQQLLFKMRAHSINWLRKRLISVYGNSIAPYALDCVTILNGMFKEYVMYIVFDQKELQLAALVEFIMRRMDAIVGSFSSDEAPLLDEAVMEDFIHIEEITKQVQVQHIVQTFSQLRNSLAALSLHTKQTEQILASLDAMETEFTGIPLEPREYIVRGLMLYLQNQHIPALEQDIQLLQSAVDAYF